MADTIFALSSGAPPAAIAIIRISGAQAGAALAQLAGRVPQARHATLVTLRDASAGVLDRALALWLPGPGTATGEDIAELHCHGGRAVIAAVAAALAAVPGLRPADPGEFTRRAFVHGQIDLAEAEGLADLLAAETEMQRQTALALAGGALSATVALWRDQVLTLSAGIEAVLDFGDEDDVPVLPDRFAERVADLQIEIADWLIRPRAEILRDGFRVVLAGPPNAGKSTLFNALVESEAAITAPIAGTTRDVLTQTVGLSGVPFRFFDTAGLREPSGEQPADYIEAIGIERARAAIGQADLTLWLGAQGDGPPGAWEIAAKADLDQLAMKVAPRHRVSAVTGSGLDDLRADLVAAARGAMPRPGQAALNARQHDLLAKAASALGEVACISDLLLIAESLRLARVAFDSLLGRTTTEDMLDTLFGRFCIGK